MIQQILELSSISWISQRDEFFGINMSFYFIFIYEKKEFIVIFLKKQNVWPYIIGLFNINGENGKNYIDNLIIFVPIDDLDQFQSPMGYFLVTQEKGQWCRLVSITHTTNPVASVHQSSDLISHRQHMGLYISHMQL
jgi:hypothetical protein